MFTAFKELLDRMSFGPATGCSASRFCEILKRDFAVKTGIAFVLGYVCSIASTQAAFYSGIIDFTYYYPPGTPYGPGAAAIGSAGDLWNSAPVSGSLSPLITTTGAQTDVGWSIASGGGAGTFMGGTYGALFSSETYFDTASISGLTPNAPYNLYVYASEFPNAFSVNNVSYSTPYHYDTSSLHDGTQYDVETVTANSSGQLIFTSSGGSVITSWQLTPAPVPEPTAISLGGLVLFLARRQFRRAR